MANSELRAEIMAVQRKYLDGGSGNDFVTDLLPLMPRILAALAASSVVEEPDFGTAEEVIAGLDSINAHNAALAVAKPGERFHIEIKHPDWLEHCTLESTFSMYRDGKLPPSIAGWMLVTPIRHALRCIYGSDLEAADALRALVPEGRGAK